MDETILVYMLICAIIAGIVKLLIFLFGIKVATMIFGLSIGITLGSAFLKGSSKNSKR